MSKVYKHRGPVFHVDRNVRQRLCHEAQLCIYCVCCKHLPSAILRLSLIRYASRRAIAAMSPAVNGHADQPVVIITGGGNGMSLAPRPGVSNDR